MLTYLFFGQKTESDNVCSVWLVVKLALNVNGVLSSDGINRYAILRGDTSGQYRVEQLEMRSWQMTCMIDSRVRNGFVAHSSISTFISDLDRLCELYPWMDEQLSKLHVWQLLSN